MNGAKNVDIHIAVKKDARSNLNAESESSQLEIREIGEKTLERETCRGEGTLVNITSITLFNKQPNVFQLPMLYYHEAFDGDCYSKGRGGM